MSRDGGAKEKSQSIKKTIISELSNTKEEKNLRQSAETSVATGTGEISADVTQESAPSMSSNPTALDDSEGLEEESTRHVIAVSASKGPAAFFNLARKFLATDEMCDLSALEGAIVSAVDAAHLLERSKLATIERIQTSFVAVEAKRKKTPVTQHSSHTSESDARVPLVSLKTTPTISSGTPIPATKVDLETRQVQSALSPAIASKPAASPTPAIRSKKSKSGTSSEVRRARIMITVKRTPEYKQWLLDNPIPDSSTGDDEDTNAPHIEASMQPKS